ncbi:amidase family protein [Paenibacillus sp. N3/727]|uniref:amidase family protein n=1 Tax=Paenibacillus sp. N3/727 TaxID=2925845 RepID=UPI001F539906|nr:amidase family protein [Paenibacillus sp. N3/727]UNK16480.1 amidase family protein [Paenibacillus sp. N3/727]
MLLDKETWIVEATITDMQQAMGNGWITSEEIVQLYIDRITQYDPKLRSILEVNPDAAEIARSLDMERREKGSRGKLHGIPIVLKDNIDTGDRMHTSAGSLALADSYASEDSFVAAKLRSAGAVLLGKANMTEWANFMSTTMWAGYSSRGGLVLNPYGPGDLFIGGSSSGPAAAAAANLCAAAIGTETSGSIISPASQTCLVGIKPTVGLVSRTGIIPITYTQDSPGPMTRTVSDAAIILSALTGVDDRDEKTLASAVHVNQDYTAYLDEDYLKQARIGIPRHYYKDLDKDRLEVIEAAIEVLKEQGATIIDPVDLPSQETQWDSVVLKYEFKKYLNDYLGKLEKSIPVHSLADVIAFNEEHADKALKYGQNLMIMCEETNGTLTEQEYLDSIKQNLELAGEQGIDFVLREYQLDAIMFLGDEDCNDLAAQMGYPAITVPGGYAQEGVIASEGYNTKGPQGVTFVGTAFNEPTLFKLAYGYEQATKHRKPPVMDPSC